MQRRPVVWDEEDPRAPWDQWKKQRCDYPRSPAEHRSNRPHNVAFKVLAIVSALVLIGVLAKEILPADAEVAIDDLRSEGLPRPNTVKDSGSLPGPAKSTGVTHAESPEFDQKDAQQLEEGLQQNVAVSVRGVDEERTVGGIGSIRMQSGPSKPAEVLPAELSEAEAAKELEAERINAGVASAGLSGQHSGDSIAEPRSVTPQAVGAIRMQIAKTTPPPSDLASPAQRTVVENMFAGVEEIPTATVKPPISESTTTQQVVMRVGRIGAASVVDAAKEETTQTGIVASEGLGTIHLNGASQGTDGNVPQVEGKAINIEAIAENERPAPAGVGTVHVSGAVQGTDTSAKSDATTDTARPDEAPPSSDVGTVHLSSAVQGADTNVSLSAIEAKTGNSQADTFPTSDVGTVRVDGVAQGVEKAVSTDVSESNRLEKDATLSSGVGDVHLEGAVVSLETNTRETAQPSVKEETSTGHGLQAKTPGLELQTGAEIKPVVKEAASPSADIVGAIHAEGVPVPSVEQTSVSVNQTDSGPSRITGIAPASSSPSPLVEALAPPSAPASSKPVESATSQSFGAVHMEGAEEKIVPSELKERDFGMFAGAEEIPALPATSVSSDASVAQQQGQQSVPVAKTGDNLQEVAPAGTDPGKTAGVGAVGPEATASPGLGTVHIESSASSQDLSGQQVSGKTSVDASVTSVAVSAAVSTNPAPSDAMFAGAEELPARKVDLAELDRQIASTANQFVAVSVGDSSSSTTSSAVSVQVEAIHVSASVSSPAVNQASDNLMFAGAEEIPAAAAQATASSTESPRSQGVVQGILASVGFSAPAASASSSTTVPAANVVQEVPTHKPGNAAANAQETSSSTEQARSQGVVQGILASVGLTGSAASASSSSTSSKPAADAGAASFSVGTIHAEVGAVHVEPAAEPPAVSAPVQPSVSDGSFLSGNSVRAAVVTESAIHAETAVVSASAGTASNAPVVASASTAGVAVVKESVAEIHAERAAAPQPVTESVRENAAVKEVGTADQTSKAAGTASAFFSAAVLPERQGGA